MSHIYSETQKQYIYAWNSRNVEKRREINKLNQRRYDAKKREWRNVCKVFRFILLE